MTSSQVQRIVHVKSEKPWPFNVEQTTTICRFAGREASAALLIALSGNKSSADVAPAAREAAYYEPSTYWDWHGVHPDTTRDSAHELKRQRMWEYQRGFVQDTSASASFGYPTPRQRWRSFKNLIEGDRTRGAWVKRIALAHWMTARDLIW